MSQFKLDIKKTIQVIPVSTVIESILMKSIDNYVMKSSVLVSTNQIQQQKILNSLNILLFFRSCALRTLCRKFQSAWKNYVSKQSVQCALYRKFSLEILHLISKTTFMSLIIGTIEYKNSVLIWIKVDQWIFERKF